MINYSIVMRGNPTDKAVAKKRTQVRNIRK